MEPLIFTQSNSATAVNYEFERNFQSPFTAKNLEVALTSAVIPHSVMNFDSTNNKFHYKYQGTDYLVDLGDAYLDIFQIQTVCERQFLDNNHYLVDTLGNPVFFIQFGLSLATYKFHIQFSTLVLGSNTNPHGLVLDGNTMQLVIGDNLFGRRIGFNASQTIPTIPSPLIQTILSDNIPQITDLQAICVCLPNFVSSIGFSSVPSSIATIPISSSYGTNINYQPINLLWYPVTNSTYRSITCRITDQNSQALNMIDSNVVLEFQFRERR